MLDTMILDENSIEITRKNIKNLHLRVYPPNGIVRISAPLHMKLETIRAFVISKIQWIKYQQKKLTIKNREPVRLFEEGENHSVWGELYSLKIIQQSRMSEVQVKNNHIYLFLRGKSSFEKKQTLMDVWYREEVRKVAQPLLEKWQILIGVKVKGIFIQKMKTRWGSCHTQKANIRFNSELAKKPQSCLEYVVVHELVHLLEPSHNHRFKALMDQFMPDWRFRRKLLRKFP